eukprot:CAMPEP_0185582976 /NCGR_PEP_ID=MMETSP0434-20130131/21245_1 /TAXON_ID=626734 ORGANISM="Favella taraikaensis, Strain Fe Narragansett Bay" /NCGR_SAMPLE_ID=MMETSP0434 /ASSEMBLY_ACC=CAM_ASM_000379 /LENGTH=89 /DNA_ID=CAMNT_0028201949 /DNA_START=250 /DNA_END=519 /DNA_ORIENTATION=+
MLAGAELPNKTKLANATRGRSNGANGDAAAAAEQITHRGLPFIKVHKEGDDQTLAHRVRLPAHAREKHTRHHDLGEGRSRHRVPLGHAD